MADRLGLGTQVRELKIGQSFFTQNGQGGGSGHKQGNRGRTMGRQGAGGAAGGASAPAASFHTIRYDFKPASVDQTSQDSKVSIAQDGRGVTVEVPNLDGGVTNYRQVFFYSNYSIIFMSIISFCLAAVTCATPARRTACSSSTTTLARSPSSA